MSFDFDEGGGGSQGPWIVWSAGGTQDGTVPAKSFYIRDKDGKRVFEGFGTGVVLDIRTMKTGWCHTTGVQGQAPQWTFGASLSKLPDRPSEEHKKGFQMRCAIGGGETATWEDSGAGTWNAFCDLIPALKAGPTDHDQLPLVRITGSRFEQFGKGSTVIPILEVVRWVPRPDCLKDGVAGGVDTGQQPAAVAQQPAQAAAPSSIPADATF